MRAVVLVLALSGCSFVFTSNPPPPCNSSTAPAIVDTAAAVVAAIAAVYFVTDDEAVATVAASATAVTYGTSAVVGFRRVARCRDAKALPR
jgi:uncharacterized protein (DUF362 family)